jgi:hypothetical protein
MPHGIPYEFQTISMYVYSPKIRVNIHTGIFKGRRKQTFNYLFFASQYVFITITARINLHHTIQQNYPFAITMTGFLNFSVRLVLVKTKKEETPRI